MDLRPAEHFRAFVCRASSKEHPTLVLPLDDRPGVDVSGFSSVPAPPFRYSPEVIFETCIVCPAERLFPFPPLVVLTSHADKKPITFAPRTASFRCAHITRGQEAADNHPSIAIIDGHAFAFSHKIHTSPTALGGALLLRPTLCYGAWG